MNEREPKPPAPKDVLDNIQAQSRELAKLARGVDDDIAYMLDMVVQTIHLRRSRPDRQVLRRPGERQVP